MQATASRGHYKHFAHPAKNVESLPISANSVIADFGAGSGHYTYEMARQLTGSGRVYAIDVQADLLRRIKNEATSRGLKNVETIHADIARSHGTKLADATCDLVLLSNVLFQQEYPASALKEAWRVIRPTGHVVIIDWEDSYAGMGPTKKHVITPVQALDMAESNGFELLREFEAGAYHYGLIFRPVPKNRI